MFGADKLRGRETVVAAPESCDGDHSHSRIPQYQLPDGFNTILCRHHDIRDYDINVVLIEDLGTLYPIGGFVNRVALSRQKLLDECAHFVIVFDHQNLRHCTLRDRGHLLIRGASSADQLFGCFEKITRTKWLFEYPICSSIVSYGQVM